ncbi:TRAP transporter solute receptor, unknown substrate 3 [Candidatus Rhodobacter oscarellae]|uniref:TRAP transporter solute receptor n=1 Tax=Candidatus Rhodobacter oscarellae TaxID=1675527 RepID=A0A0J9E5S8_9RHOB|nr:TRAP transporter substrate-binding protein [Candidatus Rhodobacter lobularis]KMW58097.1 TRAP transporter solute receptor, unknown substrate 3 [Candidatus Rhodobacter lobularis]
MALTKTLLAGAAALALTATTALAQEVTLRFQHFISPKGAVPALFMTPWAEKVMADSNGRLKIELYPGMQLGGKPPALYDQIRDGVIDGGWALPAYTPGRFPETEAFELPFVSSKSAELTSKAAWEFAEKYLGERMGDVHLLAVHVHGSGIIHTKGDPITGPADFAGKKLRGPSRAANNLLSAMGATPVGMPVPAFPEALSKGVVEGGVIPWEIVLPLKVHELADSHAEVAGPNAMYNTFFIWAMNKDSYNNLPDDLKAVIDANSGLETSAWAGRAMDEGDTMVKAVVEGTDNTIITMSEEATAEIKAIADGQIAEWVTAMDAAGLPGQAMLDDARALIEKHGN